MKIVFSNSKWLLNLNIQTDNISDIQLEILSDSEVVYIESINPPLEYKVHIKSLPSTQEHKLVKLTYILKDSDDNEIYRYHEYLLILNKNNIPNIEKYVLKEDLVYRDILLTTLYNKLYRDLFLEPDTLDEKYNLIYQPDDTSYSGVNDSYFIQSILSDDTNNYRDFLVHIESENENYRVEYSLDNGNNWNVINSDEDIHVDEDIVNLDIKVTLTGDNTIYSFGVMYDKQE